MSIEEPTTHPDLPTAEAFATSWNNLPAGSVYTWDQFTDWLAPLTIDDVRGRTVVELGCGNGSLLVHMTRWEPAQLTGVDLGPSVRSARSNLGATGFTRWNIEQSDLTTYASDGYDLAYCIGVLHHLESPHAGFRSVVANAKPGGRFHCWVYAREGNLVVIVLVEPLRRLASKLPWWLNKYAIATPLAVPFWLYAKAIRALNRGDAPRPGWLARLPLYEYSLWIAKREFGFFRHVAFDQLVTPRTAYLSRREIESWLADEPRVDPGSAYVVFRNGNSWKFGGRTRPGPGSKDI